MGKLFYVMGPSASGKDTIYQALLGMPELELSALVPYTTRPIRTKETEGEEYHFVDEEKLWEFKEAGKVIELREYHTVQGPWYYFTVDDGSVDLAGKDYLAIGTLVSYEKLKAYYGSYHVCPIYIQVSERVRLERAMKRESKQEVPQYQEMCRRFLADCADFSEERLKACHITQLFPNDGDREECILAAARYIEAQKNH